MTRLIDDGMIRIGRFQIHKSHCLGVDERAFYNEAPDFYLNEFANRKLRDMDMILEISCMSK